MVNMTLIIGRVVKTYTEVFNSNETITVVVKTGGGISQSGKAWEQHAACRFWGDAKKYASPENTVPGTLVKIDASTPSREGGEKKIWFSNIQSRFLTVLDKPRAAPVSSAAAAPGPSDSFPDLDVLPF